MKFKNKFSIKRKLFYFIILICIIYIFISSGKIKKFELNINNHIKIYLTQPFNYNFKNSPIEKLIIDLLDSASQEVYLFCFDIDNANILNKLIEIQKKGIKVQIIIDPDNTPSKIISILKHFNMLKDYNPPKLMHHKILLIDNKITTLGSMNFTVNGIYFNNNDFIVLNNKKINNFFKSYFYFLIKEKNICSHYLNTKIGEIPISIYLTRFNDIDVNSIIKNYIKKSNKLIYFAYSTFTNNDIAKLMIKEINNKNLDFSGVLEKRNSYSKYSVYNYFVANRLKIFRDENEAIMHLKLLVIDDFTITGSYAIANRSNKKSYLNRYNDDLIIIFKSKIISSFYLKYIKNIIHY